MVNLSNLRQLCTKTTGDLEQEIQEVERLPYKEKLKDELALSRNRLQGLQLVSGLDLCSTANPTFHVRCPAVVTGLFVSFAIPLHLVQFGFLGIRSLQNLVNWFGILSLSWPIGKVILRNADLCFAL